MKNNLHKLPDKRFYHHCQHGNCGICNIINMPDLYPKIHKKAQKIGWSMVINQLWRGTYVD